MAEAIQPVYHYFDLGFDTEDIKRVAIKQDSDRTHVLVIKIYTNDDQMTLNPSWDYHITMKKPDGKLIVDTANIEVRENVIYVTCTAQMLSAPGTSMGELVIFNDNQSLYTNNFYIYVDPDLIDGDEVESTDEFNSLVDVLRQIRRYEQAAQTSAANALSSEDNAAASATNAADYEAQILAILNSLRGYDSEIESLMEQLRSKNSQIDDLKNQVQAAVDDVNNLLSQLEELGVAKIEDVANNAKALRDEIQDINNSAKEAANSVTSTVENINSIYTEMSEKSSSFDSEYNAFSSRLDEINDKISQVDSFLSSLDSVKNSVLSSQSTVNDTLQAIDEDATTITGIKTEAEDILRELREILANAQSPSSGSGDETQAFDPIIVSELQPGANKQEEDDMWLKPYD